MQSGDAGICAIWREAWGKDHGNKVPSNLGVPWELTQTQESEIQDVMECHVCYHLMLAQITNKHRKQTNPLHKDSRGKGGEGRWECCQDMETGTFRNILGETRKP